MSKNFQQYKRKKECLKSKIPFPFGKHFRLRVPL